MKINQCKIRTYEDGGLHLGLARSAASGIPIRVFFPVLLRMYADERATAAAVRTYKYVASSCYALRVQ